MVLGRRVPIEEVRVGLQKGIANAKEQLESIKSGFLEELEDAGQTFSGKTLKAYEGLELHPAIEKAAGKLFRDGYYANAIEDAVKALNTLVKLNRYRRQGWFIFDGVRVQSCEACIKKV